MRPERPDDKGKPLRAKLYMEAGFRESSFLEPHEIPIPTLAEAVARIVDYEGPIHQEEVGRRLGR